MDIVDAARMLAMGDMVDADSAIACFDAKYHYCSAAGQGDPERRHRRNDATVADPYWTPLITTPNHPEFPAAHGCLTGAEAEMYSVALGTKPHRRHDPRLRERRCQQLGHGQTYEKVNDLQREIVDARVWAGSHYRESGVEGVVGRPQGRALDAQALLPSDLVARNGLLVRRPVAVAGRLHPAIRSFERARRRPPPRPLSSRGTA